MRRLDSVALRPRPVPGDLAPAEVAALDARAAAGDRLARFFWIALWFATPGQLGAVAEAWRRLGGARP